MLIRAAVGASPSASAKAADGGSGSVSDYFKIKQVLLQTQRLLVFFYANWMWHKNKSSEWRSSECGRFLFPAGGVNPFLNTEHANLFQTPVI